MASQPTTTNAWATWFDNLINSLTTGGVDLAESYILTTPMAWLEWPGIKIITNEILTALGNSVDKYNAQMVAAAVIEVQTNGEKSALGNAVIKQQQAVASGDQNAIAAAQSSFDNAFGSLVGWDGSAPPTT